jgi:general secretion pathway protein F
MATYKATIKSGKGVAEFEVEAQNLEEARATARRRGKVMTVKKVSVASSLFETYLTVAERQILLQNMSNMLAAKLGASEAIEVIKRTFTGNIKKISDKILRHMETGADVVEALERIGAPNFPETVLALIRAGSRSGETWRSLRDAALFEQDIENVKKGSKGGIGAGMAGFVAAAGVTMFTKFYAAPELMSSKFFQMTQDKMDLTVINILSDVVGYSMLFFSIIFVLLLLLGGLGRKIVPAIADSIVMKIPFYKDLILAKNNYTTLYGLSLLIRSGVPMEQSLSLTAQSSPKGALRKDLEKAVAAIKKGKPWAAAMDSLEETDKAALSVSADREQIANTLNNLSIYHKNAYARVVGSVGPTLQLIAAIFLVLSGGVLFGYTMLPMLQVASQGMG